MIVECYKNGLYLNLTSESIRGQAPDSEGGSDLDKIFRGEDFFGFLFIDFLTSKGGYPLDSFTLAHVWRRPHNLGVPGSNPVQGNNFFHFSFPFFK